MITLYQSVAYSSGFLQRVKKLAVTSLYAAVAAAMFGVSVPTFLRGLGQPLPAGVPPVIFREWADRTHDLQVSTFQNIYSFGLQVMKKILLNVMCEFQLLSVSCLGSMRSALLAHFRKHSTKPSQQVAAPDCRTDLGFILPGGSVLI